MICPCVGFAMTPFSFIARQTSHASLPFFGLITTALSKPFPRTSSIISELMPGDSVSLNYSNDAVVLGLGRGDTIKGYISKNNSIQAGRLKLSNKTVYVL